MEVFNIKIADIVIGITCLHTESKEFCREYLTEESATVNVEVTQKDIDYEAEKSDRERRLEGLPLQSFSDEYLETLAIYRKIAVGLLEYDTFLFHGSVIAVDGQGYLFTARSGTGKSTHTRLWREKFGDRAVMVNDDKPLLKVTDNGIVAYGTPWDGKHHLSTNVAVPLKAVCILKRGSHNHIRRIDRKGAYSMLLQQIYRPTEAGALMKAMELLDILGEKTSLYELHCNMSPEAATVAYEGMKG